MRIAPSLDGVAAGGFRVSGVWRPGSLLILDDMPGAWPPSTIGALSPDDFATVIAAGPAVSEFVLLGTGPVQALPPRAVRERIAEAGLGLEFMASEAAARLHNVLVSEGRRFATALLVV